MKRFDLHLCSNKIGCVGCTAIVEKAVKDAISNATDIVVSNIATGEAQVSFSVNKDISYKDLLLEFAKYHQDEWVVTDTLAALPSHKRLIQQRLFRETILCLIAATSVFFLGLYSNFFISYLAPEILSLGCGALCTGVVLYFGRRYFADAFTELSTGKVSNNSIISFTIIILLLLSMSSTGFGFAMGHMLCLEHFHCPILLLASLTFRDWLSLYLPSMKTPDSKAFKSHLDSTKYRVRKNSKINYEDTIEISKISIGDYIDLEPGQMVPCDAKIISNDSGKFIRLSDTGDKDIHISDINNGSETVDVKCGWVYSSKNKQNIKLQAVKVKGKTDQAETRKKAQKLNLERCAERKLAEGRFFNIFSLVVVVIATVSPLVWSFMLPSFNLINGLNMFLSIMLVACPCTLLVVKPYVQNYASSKAYEKSGNSLLIKDFSVWSALNKDNLVFCWDRTNTLTDPNSDNANTARSEAKGVLSNLMKHGYANHIILSGNNGNDEGKNFLNELGPSFKVINHNCPKLILPNDLNGTQAFFNLTAAKKLEFVEQLQSMGKTVIMIGDGENDLLALAKADISIGVWHENVSYGSALPSEMSDIRLNNSLMGLQDLLSLSTRVNILSSRLIFLSVAYNLCCLAIVAGGYYYFTGGFVEPFVASLTMCFGFVLSFSSASLSLNMGFLRSDSEESSNSMKPSNSTIIDKKGDEMLNTNIGNNTAFTEEGKSLIAAQAI